MREMGLHEDTLVVVTSAHGEGFGEHGERGHGFLVHQATLHVPLIWWCPGVLPQGRVVEDPVRSIDVVPTLLDLLELPPKPDAEGTSLLPRLGLSPDGVPLEVYGESMAAKLRFGHSPVRSLRIGAWKYILDPTPELYQIGDDPGELRDLSREMPERAAELRRRLLTLVGRAARAQPFDQDPEPSGKDPGDTIRVVNLVAQGESYREKRRWRKAGDSFREALALDPGNELARVYLAWLQADQGNMERAIAWLNRLRPLSASRPSRMQSELYLRAEAWERAAAVSQHLAEREPHNAWAHYDMGQAYRKLGAQAEAIHAFERAIESEPAMADAHSELAAVYLEEGQIDRALGAYRAALALLPDSSEYHGGLGRALQAKTSCREAVGEYRKAAELDPANLEAIESSGLCLLRLGDVEAAGDYAWQILRGTSNNSLALVIFGARRTREGLLEPAVSMLEKAIELDPESFDAWYYLAVAQARQDEVAPALSSLERVFTLGGEPYASLAREEKAFAPLADDPRFRELVSPSDS
jgi:tetratricopeptide (TPR) repeat protein